MDKLDTGHVMLQTKYGQSPNPPQEGLLDLPGLAAKDCHVHVHGTYVPNRAQSTPWEPSGLAI